MKLLQQKQPYDDAYSYNSVVKKIMYITTLIMLHKHVIAYKNTTNIVKLMFINRFGTTAPHHLKLS